jgi:DMSO/TMAO reductase YedYZ heme-binding membrane subunit
MMALTSLKIPRMTWVAITLLPAVQRKTMRKRANMSVQASNYQCLHCRNMKLKIVHYQCLSCVDTGKERTKICKKAGKREQLSRNEQWRKKSRR